MENNSWHIVQYLLICQGSYTLSSQYRVSICRIPYQLSLLAMYLIRILSESYFQIPNSGLSLVHTIFGGEDGLITYGFLSEGHDIVDVLGSRNTRLLSLVIKPQVCPEIRTACSLSETHNFSSFTTKIKQWKLPHSGLKFGSPYTPILEKFKMFCSTPQDS